MVKKSSSLTNRLARQVTGSGGSGVVAAALRPAAEDRPLGAVVWEVLSPACKLAVADAAEFANRFAGLAEFGTGQATGWIAGLLGTFGPFLDQGADPLADPKLRTLEDDVLAALGLDAVWQASGEHPVPAFRPRRRTFGGMQIIEATFELVVAARGNGWDLVLARADED